MCRTVGLGEELGVAILRVILPLCVLPMALAVLAWRREERWPALVAAAAGALATGLAWAMRPVVSDAAEPARALVLLAQRSLHVPTALYAAAWLVAAARPRLRSVGLAAALLLVAWGVLMLGALAAARAACA